MKREPKTLCEVVVIGLYNRETEAWSEAHGEGTMTESTSFRRQTCGSPPGTFQADAYPVLGGQAITRERYLSLFRNIRIGTVKLVFVRAKMILNGEIS